MKTGSWTVMMLFFDQTSKLGALNSGKDHIDLKKKGRTRLNTTTQSQEKTMTNQWLKTKVMNKT